MAIAIIALIYALSAIFALLLSRGSAIGKDQKLEDEEQLAFIEKYMQNKLKYKK